MVLGILGGCGPAAGAHFYSRLVALTEAKRDSDHVDVLLSGRASTPDRTQAILHGGESPVDALIRDAAFLAEGGADLLVLLCHTAHAYLSELRAALHIPILDMVSVTVGEVWRLGARRLGVLCTAGTRRARLYERAAADYGITILYPSLPSQEGLNNLIYEVLKRGRTDFGAAVRTAVADLAALGCDAVSLSCTELSLPQATGGAAHFFWRDPPGAILPMPMIDPIELTARRAILACGKRLKRKEEHHAPVKATVISCRRSPAGRGMG
ncbi:MAG: aspartate/glutamate racemase family protein [Clostridia bacterium]|nr:aspartate/glutamate racemase family protein [Clostridia bacterium]